MEIDVRSIGGIVTFFLYSASFLLASFVALTLPGQVIIAPFFREYGFGRKIVLFTACGAVMWIAQSVLFGYLHIRNATYIYLGVIFYLSLPNFGSTYRECIQFFTNIHKKNMYIFIILLLGVFVQCAQTIPSGFIFPKGWYSYVSADSLWHVGLTSELVEHFPPNMPGLNGVLMQNYHYFSNLFVAEFVRVFRLPLVSAQFLFSYGLISFLYGGIAYCIAREARFSRLSTFVTVFLAYFSSDVIYIVSFITRKVFDFSVHPLEDMTMMFENPPRAWSFLLSLLGILLLMRYVKTKKIILAIFTGITFGLVIGCKVHTGIMVLAGLGMYGVWQIYFRRWRLFLPVLVAYLVSIIVYVPVNAGAGGPVYAPFEMARMFVVQPNLKLSYLELRRQIYVDHNNILRIWEMNLIMLGIFLIGQFGIRNLGWFGIRSAMRYFGKPITITIIGGLIGTLILGTFFIQPLTNADIFNSYLAGSLFLFLLTAVFFHHCLTKNRIIGYILLVAIILLPIPRCIYRISNLMNRIKAGSPIVSIGEIQAMIYLKLHSQKEDVILVFNQVNLDGYQAYVTAFTGRETFLSGRQILNDRRIRYDDRFQFMQTIEDVKPDMIKKTFARYHIRYLYYYGKKTLTGSLRKLPLHLFFENDIVTIYAYDE